MKVDTPTLIWLTVRGGCKPVINGILVCTPDVRRNEYALISLIQCIKLFYLLQSQVQVISKKFTCCSYYKLIFSSYWLFKYVYLKNIKI